jgi:hypothetical protein
VTQPRREEVRSRVLHAQEPNWVGAFVGGGIAVEEVAHCLVEMAFTVFCGGQQSRRLALGELEGGGMVLMRWGRDRSVAEELKAC